MTSSFSPRTLALLGGFSAAALVLAGQPAEAHGIAAGGLAPGFLHPLQGLDHLLLLVGVGTAASAISSQLLLWALAGAAGGGLFGALGGALPGQELFAALAISAIGALVLGVLRARRAPNLGLCGGLVAAAVAVHAMLHGLEAPGESASTWWLGAATASALVTGASYALMQRLPLACSRTAGLLLAVLGGGLAIGSLGLALG